VLGFLTISLIGLLWADSYHNVISDPNWFIAYSISIGWWLAAFPAREYYLHNEQYFDDYI